MPYSPPSTSVNLTGPITSLGSVTSIASQTGTGSKFVVDTSPTLITPDLGTPSALVGTNISGTAAGLTAGNVTTNANLTGGVTSIGNAATVVTNADLTGDVTSVGNATTLTNAPVIAKVLTGYSSGAGTVAATDSILQAIQKLDGNDSTNADLTGVITSSGNATSIASQTGTGTKFVVDTSPTLVTPILGTPASGTLTNCTFPTLNQNTTGTAAGLSATLAIASGGTAATTAGAALTSLGAYPSANPSGYTSNTGTVTSVTGTAPVFSSGGTTPVISMTAASPSDNGYMTAAYVTKLNGIATGATANTGTVTSVSTSGNVSGITLTGSVTTSGTLTLGGAIGTLNQNTTGSSGSCTGNAATATTAANSTLAGGLAVHSTTINNEANKIVRTESNGYCNFGWINTVSGDNSTTAINRIYASQDQYLRYYTLANFTAQIAAQGGSWIGSASTLVAGNNYTINRLMARQSGVSMGSGNSAQIEVNNAGSGACNISFHREGAYGAHFGLDTDNVFSTYGWSAGAGYTAMRVGAFTANGAVTANGAITTTGALTVGSGLGNSDIYMVDTDEGTRRIHCNSNRIGFLNQSNGWGAYCNDDGSWGVDGAITATGNITAYYSDDRLKTKLGNIENALDKVCSLDGFYYEANETAQALGYKPVREVGLSAQSVQKVLPEVIAPAPIDPQYLTMHYERVVPLLVEAIKELRAEVSALKKCGC